MLLWGQISDVVGEIATKRLELDRLLDKDVKDWDTVVALSADIDALEADIDALERDVDRANRWLRICGVAL